MHRADNPDWPLTPSELQLARDMAATHVERQPLCTEQDWCDMWARVGIAIGLIPLDALHVKEIACAAASLADAFEDLDTEEQEACVEMHERALWKALGGVARDG